MKAYNYVNQDRALHADILETLRAGGGELLYESDTALLLREGRSGLYMLSAATPEEGAALLELLPGEPLELVLRGEGLAELARERLGLESAPPFRQVLYEGAPLPEAGTLDIRRPDAADFPKVCATYTLTPPELLIHDFESPDFLGGYWEGEFACYVGLHPEGSMGLLHVFEPYRRRGFAEQIYRRLINNQLRQGRLPYAQVLTDNAASLALQRKLGFTFAARPLHWMWRDA